jgi:hypothetical protein
MQHIVQLAKEIVAEGAANRAHLPSFEALMAALNEELANLDARDFLPSARFEFVYLRKMLLNAHMIYTGTQIATPLARLLKLLEQYGGEGSRSITRTFPFVHDEALRTIVERDYRELASILFPSGAWKTVVIMAGSILEAVLYDALTVDAATVRAAEQAVRAPKRRDKRVKPIASNEWTLADFIKVAADINLLPKEREETIDQTLREYRNFVHPKREIRAAHSCSEAEALMAKGALDGVLNHFGMHLTVAAPNS